MVLILISHNDFKIDISYWFQNLIFHRVLYGNIDYFICIINWHLIICFRKLVMRNKLLRLYCLIFELCCVLCHSEKRIIFTFERLPNGTFVPVIKRLTTTTDENNASLSSSLIASIFIFLLFLIGFIGSVLLISTIGSSLTLRRLPFNIIILNLGVVILIECIFNLGLSFVYLVIILKFILIIISENNGFSKN